MSVSRIASKVSENLRNKGDLLLNFTLCFSVKTQCVNWCTTQDGPVKPGRKSRTNGNNCGIPS